MTYILNAIPLGTTAPEVRTSGLFVAEPDDPAFATLKMEGETVSGIRYLLVSDDGSGYTSSASFVHLPADADEPATLHLGENGKAFEHLLASLLAQSPVRRLILYLEANRVISRLDPKEEHQPSIVARRPMPLAEVLASIRTGQFAEEVVYVVQDMAPS